MSIVHDTDVTMAKLWVHLVRDFRTFIGQDYNARVLALFKNNGVKALRDFTWPTRMNCSPILFKCEYQLESLFKRYRFKDDKFSDSDLIDGALEKFTKCQERVASPMQTDLLTKLWLKRARKICNSILGSYDLEEHYKSCRFGKRACVGTAYKNSYLDFKLTRELTGSAEHIQWFSKYIETDLTLKRFLLSQSDGLSPRYKVCNQLTLALVPKSYKSYRTILKNTLLGSFYTYGLGRVIQTRLKSIGLDITRLQEQHGRLAQVSSRTKRLATADLSAASDSISRELLSMILPRKWYHAVMHGSIPTVKVGTDTLRMSSVITMGMGHTFPLQTLIFYCLIKAIGELKGESRTFVSVYGDDLIYPSRLHRYVKVLFPRVHLNLNGDKTYVQDFFRESCGSDYYHGFDVRPFSYRGEHQLLGKLKYASFLYQLLNGLRRRWDEVEIPQAIDYLLTELYLTQHEVYQVPPSFPDGSGYKVVTPLRNQYFWSQVLYSRDTFSYTFKYIRDIAKKRPVLSTEPYYWERMRSSQIENACNDTWDLAIDEPVIHWERTKRPPKNYRSSLTGRRIRHLTPVVDMKSTTIPRCQIGSTSSWV